MLDAKQEQAYRAEAERLALLPVEDQREIIALHRSTAGNTKAPKREREIAREAWGAGRAVCRRVAEDRIRRSDASRTAWLGWRRSSGRGQHPGAPIVA